MTSIRELAIQVHQLAWSAVRGPAWDPWTAAGGSRQERRAGSVQLLAVYSQLVRVLQRRINLMMKDALDAGSDYGEIAAACGVSRQAIRQRCLRHAADLRWFDARLPTPRPGSERGRRDGLASTRALPVRLVGGPYHGRHDIPAPGEVLKYAMDRPPSESGGPLLLLAWYVPSQDDAGVYIFAGVEPDTWRMYTTGLPLPASAGAARLRVYELAAELGVEIPQSW